MVENVEKKHTKQLLLFTVSQNDSVLSDSISCLIAVKLHSLNTRAGVNPL